MVNSKKMTNVHFLGYKKNVFDYQSAFDVAVFPSRNEPFGLVAVEAYYASKPTLIFDDSGGLKEIVSIINTNDIVKSEAKLAERIQYYYSNGRKIDNSKILNYFSSERMEKDYFNVY